MCGRAAVRRSAAALLGVLALTTALTACGTNMGLVSASPGLTGIGPITLAMGKDNTGTVNSILDKWNRVHPRQEVTLTELPEDADQQRLQMVQNAQTKSDAYTIYYLDVVNTSEFAEHGWVEPLPANQFPLDRYLKPVLKTARYRGQLYAAPYVSDGALLYSRSDLLTAAGIGRPPTTWDEMRADCAKVLALPQAGGMSCYSGQYDRYEGLTVNFSEAVDSAGGEVVNGAGNADVDTAAARQGLDFLVNGVKDGMIPKRALRWEEEQSRRAFEAGKLVFLRNWSYVYARAADGKDATNTVAGKFEVSPIPGRDGFGESTLGGHNLAINRYARHKQTALNFIKWFTREANERIWLTKNSQAPVYTSLYEDRTLQRQFPYLATLKRSIENAEPRPAIVDYNDATAAIEEQAYAAISGNKPSAEALRDLQASLSTIIKANQ